VQVLAGYNASVFAYGQTASGKTHTIFGDHAASQGILAHAMNHIFAAASSPNHASGNGDALTVSISVVQIYNEQISDLLWEPPPGTKRNGVPHMCCYEHCFLVASACRRALLSLSIHACVPCVALQYSFCGSNLLFTNSNGAPLVERWGRQAARGVCEGGKARGGAHSCCGNGAARRCRGDAHGCRDGNES